MSKITEILVLGANRRASQIHNYLNDKGYSVSKGILPNDNNNHMVIDENKFDFSHFNKFDLVVLGGVSKIIKEKYLRLPKFGMLTCHAGALPEYRGSSPLSWSLINNEKTFGLSVIGTEIEIDTGDIYSSARFDIDVGANIDDLHSLADNKFPFLVHTAILNIENNIPAFKQVSHFKGYYPLRHKADSQIKFTEMTAEYIKRLFNSYSPRYGYPFFLLNKKEFQVKSVEIKNEFHGVPGKIYQIKNNKILVACKIDAAWLSLDQGLEMSTFARYSSIPDT